MRQLEKNLIEILDRQMTEVRMCAAQLGVDGMVGVVAIDSIEAEPEEAHKAADLVLLGELYRMGMHGTVEAFLRAKLSLGFWYA